MIYGTPSAFLKPRQCDGMAAVERSHPRRRRRRSSPPSLRPRCRRGPPWELAISQGDGFAGVGDPGCRGCVPSLSVRDVCMRSRPVAIARHTCIRTHTYTYTHTNILEQTTRGPLPLK